MIKPIVKDIILLKRKSVDATKEDLMIAKDLIDTLNANKDTCVGMAANMIGYTKNIIIINNGLFPVIMINPKIVSKKDMYKTEESCLSLIGTRPCKRFKEIEVEYYDMNFNKQKGTYKDFTAEIIQHEIDHLSGIII